MPLSTEVTIGEGTKKERVFYTDNHFYRKKDALEWMKAKGYHEYYEIISVELPQSKEDNRRSNPSPSS